MKIESATPWLILISLVVAVVAMSAWWISASIQVTGSTTFIFMFATMGLWFSICLFALTLWRLLLSRGNVVKKSGHA